MRHLKNRNKRRTTIIMVILLTLSLPLMSQNTEKVTGPQFLFPEFTDSEVTLKNGNTEIIKLNYNTLTELMVFEMEGNVYEIVNPGLVDTIYMHNSIFVPAGEVFYEVLLVAPISLFVQHVGKLIPPGKPSGYGGTSQVSSTRMVSALQHDVGAYNLKLPDDYKVTNHPVYWINNDNVLSSFISKKQFLKIFPEKKGELKKYIKENRIKFEEQSSLIILIAHCNELDL